MAPDDPDDNPTRPLSPARRSPRIVFGDDDDDKPTVRIGGGSSSATAAPDPEPIDEPPPPAAPPPPPIVSLEPDHVVTRRIVSPRRLPSPDEPSAASGREVDLPVGWITVIAGPGRGHFAAVYHGMNSLGRDSTNRIAMPWGDDEISRREHCYITFDDEGGAFWIQHGGKSNLVRVNDAPVLAPTQISSGDTIRIGQSKIRFVALCDESFNWSMQP